MLADSADKHTQWEKMHVGQEKLLGNLAERMQKLEQAEAMHVELASQQKLQEEQQDEHHSSLQERMVYMENCSVTLLTSMLKRARPSKGC